MTRLFPEHVPIPRLRKLGLIGQRRRRRQWVIAEYARDTKCDYCGRETLPPDGVYLGQGRDRLASLDHIVPRAQGGEEHPSNFALACYACNQEKSDAYWSPKKLRTIDTWAKLYYAVIGETNDED